MLKKKDFLLKMQNYCVYQERCISEAINKLWKLECPEAWHEDIVEELILEKFINEERFCYEFAYGKFAVKSWGKKKIYQELKFKKLPENFIKKALEEAIEDKEYLRTIDRLISKKTQGKPLDFKNKNKLIRFLLQKGFEYELIEERIELFFQD